MRRRTFIASLGAVAATTIAPVAADHDSDEATLDLESGDGSHHPGPPRFMHAGEEVANPLGQEPTTRDNFGPWNPDGDETYSWSVVEAPDGTDPELSGEAVVEFDPDEPGEYRLELDASDGTHELTVRVYPDEDEDDPRPTVDLDADVVGGQVVLHATATEPEREAVVGTDLDVELYLDDRHRDRLDDPDGPISATDIDDRVRIYAVAVGARHSVPDAIDLVPDGDEIRVEHPYEVPEWAEDAVIYEIFTRRFPDQDDHTFATIADRVDHMAELGIDTLWMTPFVETDRGFDSPDGGPHGYHTVDYFATDPDLGTMADLEALVEECHDNGIRVIFDLVINHTADSHRFFEAATDPTHDEHDKYVDWYRWQDRDALEPDTYYGWSEIPNLNYDNPEVRQFALEVIDFWVEKVDGFRIDVAWGVPKSFWLEVYDRIKRHDPEYLLLDEVIHPAYDVEFSGGMTDLHYDEPLFEALNAAADGDPEGILEAIEQRQRAGAPNHALFMQYVENHDFGRYLDYHDEAAQRAAAAATFTLPGVPLIYYGQETGVEGLREAMNWGEFDEDLFAFYQRLVDLYRDHPAFGARGRLERIDYLSEGGRALAYARYDPETDRRAVVLLNFADDPGTVGVGNYVHEEDLLTGDDAEVVHESGFVTVTVDTAVVLEADEIEPFVSPEDQLATWPSEEGSDHGPGTYTYPGTEEIPEGQFDLAEVRVEDGDDSFRISFEFYTEPTNEWDSPEGFSHQHMQVYFRDPDADGGTTEAREGVNAEFEAPYHHRVVADGFAAEFEDADGNEVGGVEIEYDPDDDPYTIVLEVPADELGYVPGGEGIALVMAHDGYADGRIRAVEMDGDDWAFGGAESDDAPAVIDMVTPGDIDQSEALAPGGAIPFAPISSGFGDDDETGDDENGNGDDGDETGDDENGNSRDENGDDGTDGGNGDDENGNSRDENGDDGTDGGNGDDENGSDGSENGDGSGDDADDETDDNADDEASDDGIPGFGATAGVAGIAGGTAYAAKKAIEGNESNDDEIAEE